MQEIIIDTITEEDLRDLYLILKKTSFSLEEPELFKRYLSLFNKLNTIITVLNYDK